MSDHQVLFPSELSLENLAEFSWEINSLPPQEEICSQVGTNRFTSPTSLIFLSKTCRTRGRKYKSEKITYMGLQGWSYANNLGFSDALSLRNRPYPQGAFGGRSYIPISAMRRDALERYAGVNLMALGDAIQAKCEEIAPVVSQGLSSALQRTLANSFREIFRNTFEHSHSQSAVYCAQYWASTKTVEICIADRGIGVQRSLAENVSLGNLSTRDALMLSLMPGISSKAWRAKKKPASQRSEWDNSGHGLFFAHRLFGRLGHFFLASGENALLLRRGMPMQEMRCHVDGTIVSMQLDLSDEAEIDRSLKRVSNDAFKIKEKYGTKSVDVASVRAFLKGD